MALNLFGNPNTRKIRKYQKIVPQTNAHEEAISQLSDEALAAQTVKFKERLQNGEPLEKLIPEAFATVREASKRTLGLRPFDVQLIGGAILNDGNIAEMRTGEGKTLTATLPVYLNALTGRPVHVVTVNDYLAKRDAEWMGQVYSALGMRSAAIVPGMGEEAKGEAYKADIAYATNNELGFDYLRDNMKNDLGLINQKDHYFAIVDEVDSILIDEARTPLIISGPTPDRSELYIQINEVIPSLSDEDYEIDEKSRSATLTEDGIEKVEAALRQMGMIDDNQTLYDPEMTTLVHHVNQALLAHKIYKRDRQYLMRNGQVMLVDEFTGRVMDGRRLSNGLHQAIEAKEGVKIHPENVTLASVTYQNYFRLYEKLAGMTGTAMTEAEEFNEIYNLDTIEVPTNLPVQRIDDHDRIYRNEEGKVQAMITEVKEAHAKGQPVLIGTTSIEKSEELSERLKKVKIPHKVLNARHHEEEASIVAQAGIPGAVTIATNMAGRGTDIQLGGNMDAKILEEIEKAGENADPAAIREKVEAGVAADKEKALAAGGLFVIGTERHESRRIDNQLRGRSGRQGDPGRTLFFLSLEDDLMRIFGSDRMEKMVKTMGMKDDEAMEHPWLNKALERAQRKVEGRNFDIRKNLLKFDDIMNDQRKVVFAQRRDVLEGEDLREMVTEMRHELIEDITQEAIPERSYAEQWDGEFLLKEAREKLRLDPPVADWLAEDDITEDAVIDRLTLASDALLGAKLEKYGDETWTMVEKQVLLECIDRNWREHLEALDHLRSVISFRGYAQRDPFIEYKTESFEMFQAMLGKIREETAQRLSYVELMSQEEQEQMMKEAQAQSQAQSQAQAQQQGAQSAPAGDLPEDVDWANIGRNEPCPCGSGKKFKQCHGKVA